MELKTMTVIETCSVIGLGTPEDPCRHLYEYWTMEGKKLAEFDSTGEKQQCDGTWIREFSNRQARTPNCP